MIGNQQNKKYFKFFAGCSHDGIHYEASDILVEGSNIALPGKSEECFFCYSFNRKVFPLEKTPLPTTGKNHYAQCTLLCPETPLSLKTSISHA